MGTPQESRYLSSKEEVADVFRFFRDQQSEIKLRFNDIPQAFTARVLDLEQDTVLLQNIIPRAGLTHLNNGLEFSISGRADGLFVYITDNRALGCELEDSNGFFRIAMPTSVLYQQRRRAQRVRLPVQASSQRSHIQLGQSNPVYARILDISTSGARVLIEQARPDQLQPQQRLENCRIHVPNQLSLTVGFIVRHVQFDELQQAMTCGLEIVNADNATRDSLSSFVARITSNPF